MIIGALLGAVGGAALARKNRLGAALLGAGVGGGLDWLTGATEITREGEERDRPLDSDFWSDGEGNPGGQGGERAFERLVESGVINPF